MAAEAVQFGLTAFVTLLVIVDPFGLVPIFMAMTAGCTKRERRSIMGRGVLIGLAVALFFLLVGRAALGYLGVTVHAFAVSGGILLFFTAFPMLFGQRGSLQAPEQRESTSDDIAVFPIAIPLLAGPGTLTSILLLAAQAQGRALLFGLIALSLVVVFLATWVLLRVGEQVVARFGTSAVHVATRVMGVILAALAVQYVLNGLSGYYHTLVRP